tara:strand:- start:19 stop:171 length:153 start_codon:yes stop_codon:yes gene_type:complete
VCRWILAAVKNQLVTRLATVLHKYKTDLLDKQVWKQLKNKKEQKKISETY